MRQVEITVRAYEDEKLVGEASEKFPMTRGRLGWAHTVELAGRVAAELTSEAASDMEPWQ